MKRARFCVSRSGGLAVKALDPAPCKFFAGAKSAEDPTGL